MESTLIDIFDKTYEFCDQIQFRDYERASYETLCSRVFPGLSFEKWYQAGYWDGNLFNPHVLKDADDIVAAVSLNTMLLKIANNSPKTYIQLGGVMTDPKYRKQGLSSALIDNIMAKWNDKCQGFYLFANEKVRDFYPRFGFKEVDEFQYRMDICEGDEKAVKLNMSNKNDIKILHQHYKIGNPFSIINVDNYTIEYPNYFDTIDENMYKVNTGKVEKMIKENPYIGEVNIKRKLPSTMVLEIQERTAEFLIEYAGSYLYIDKQGYILEISSEKLELPILQGTSTVETEFKPGNRLDKEDLQKILSVFLDIFMLINLFELNFKEKKNDAAKRALKKLCVTDRI